MEPGNRNSDLTGQDQEENVRSSSIENHEELGDASGEFGDEIAGEPALDEEDLEENDLTEEDLDDIQWEEPKSDR